MKFKIIILLLICFNISFSQKKGNKEFVDAKYECSYSINYINDTLKMTQGTEDWLILKIGDDLSYEYSYLCFQLDSFFTNITKEGTEAMLESMKNGTWSTRYSGDLMYAQLYKDYKEKKLKIIDNISTHYFIYEEDLIPQNWIIMDDTMTIVGYACQKAVCDYRGRNYEAWFAPEIPISEGPWKFYGLPGLIVKLFDTKHHYEFELVELKNTGTKIDIKPPFTKKITRIGGSVTVKIIDIDRKEFIRTKFGEKANMITNADMAKVGLSNSEPVKRNYDYIELDYK